MTSDVKTFLLEAKHILQHQEQIKILKGENFNIFSILKMESGENRTHSAFIKELLDPKGSHLLKCVFLQHFLKTVEYRGELDFKNINVKLEHTIGNKDLINKTGGRIDIYICDRNGNSISIENKIYAGDQQDQIIRYVNHNKTKNTVYYLTLEGDEPSKESKQGLEAGKDFFCISYKDTIKDWLMACLKEATEQPILRETIKQYILLINKLTHQLSDQTMNEEIKNLIKENYISAKLIASNIYQVELSATYTLLNEVKSMLEQKLNEDWKITIDKDLDTACTGLKIYNSNYWQDDVFVKLEGGSKMPWGLNYYGIVAEKSKYDRADLKNRFSNSKVLDEQFKESEGWPYYKVIFDLRSDRDREKLFDSNMRKELVGDIHNQLFELLNECKEPLKNLKLVVK